MSDNKQIPSANDLKKVINKYVGYAETEIYEAVEEYTRNLIKYTLEQAAEKANLLGEGAHKPITDIQTSIYVVDQNGPDYIYKVNPESILSLEDEILKELKL